MTKEEAKHLSEILKAYSEGKVIEYRKKNTVICAWEVYKGQIIDENYYEYRIKPEPKYRSYKNAEEFLKAQKEHGPYVSTTVHGYQSVIAVYNSGVGFINVEGVLKFEEMFSNYKWQDGHPCGVEE